MPTEVRDTGGRAGDGEGDGKTGGGDADVRSVGAGAGCPGGGIPTEAPSRSPKRLIPDTTYTTAAATRTAAAAATHAMVGWV
jgi:hypothetical protein